MVEKRLILRGVAAGGFAGLLAELFTRVKVEPVIEKSIDYETLRDRALAGLSGPAPAGSGMFSRGVQRNVGAPLGMVVFGLAMGALFAVLFVLAHRRYGERLSPRVTAVGIAVFGFLGVYLLPFLKYPANPPAIGHADTIHARGNLYLGMVAVSLASLAAAWFLARRLAARWGPWNAGIATAVVFVAWIALVMAIFPAVGHLHSNLVQFGNLATETPQPLRDSHGRIVFPGFPADTLFTFRLYSVLNQLILWSTIGLTFGLLAERALAPSQGAVDGGGDPAWGFRSRVANRLGGGTRGLGRGTQPRMGR